MLWYDVILYICIYLSIYDMIFLILYKNMIYDMIWYDVVDKYQMLSHDSWLSWLFIVGGCTTDVFCFWCSTIGIRNRNMGWDSVFSGNDLRNCGIFSASHVHVPMANGFFLTFGQTVPNIEPFSYVWFPIIYSVIDGFSHWHVHLVRWLPT